MYNYSAVKSIYIKNFRNIGEVKLDFEESPIISLIGDNEAGKTSIVKAFAVAALHAWSRDQKGYIRDGTTGFGVAIELEDGSLISRMKTATLNKYSVTLPNGEVWDTNKIDSGLPVQVQSLMGMIEEPETKEFLQVRTYEDRLLFVVTPASTNYKVMYDALKVDQLTRAIKVGSKESNTLKAEINNNEASMEALTDNIRGIRIHDLEPLINIKNRISGQLESINKLERASEIAEKIQEGRKSLGAIDLIDKYKLDSIDIAEANKLNSANRLLNVNDRLGKSLKTMSKADASEFIDMTMVNKIKDVINKKDILKDRIRSAGALVKTADLREINEDRAKQLSRAKALKNKIDANLRIYETIKVDDCEEVKQTDFDIVYKISKIRQVTERNKMMETEAIKSETYVKQVQEYLKKCGAKVVDCDNCGGQVVLDMEEISHNH